jgi:hypothetical protein
MEQPELQWEVASRLVRKSSASFMATVMPNLFAIPLWASRGGWQPIRNSDWALEAMITSA